MKSSSNKIVGKQRTGVHTGNYLFKVSYGNTGTMCQICSEPTITDVMTSRRHYIVFISKLEQILHILPMFLLLFDFAQVNAGWEFNAFLFFIFHYFYIWLTMCQHGSMPRSFDWKVTLWTVKILILRVDHALDL